jgi:methylenetetrahydrofolate reductase (NADPH)
MQTQLKERPARETLPAERAAIISLMRNVSVEVSPRDAADIDAAAAHLPKGTRVFISMPPGQTYHGAVALAARLHRAGFTPVPHVVARVLASQDALDDYLARAAGEGGVREVLAIGGDRDRAAGPFDSALSLMRTGLFQKHGIRHIAIGGYPEPHPKIGAAALDQALLAKKEYARTQGIALRVVTQFCFDAEPILAFARRLRNHGLPVQAGLAGPASITTLLKFAAYCGIGNSARMLKTRGDSIIRLLTEAGPEAVVRELAAAVAAPQAAPIAGLHLFTFGGLLRTARWVQAVRDGNFGILPGHAGFEPGKAR